MTEFSVRAARRRNRWKRGVEGKEGKKRPSEIKAELNLEDKMN